MPHPLPLRHFPGEAITQGRFQHIADIVQATARIGGDDPSEERLQIQHLVRRQAQQPALADARSARIDPKSAACGRTRSTWPERQSEMHMPSLRPPASIPQMNNVVGCMRQNCLKALPAQPVGYAALELIAVAADAWEVNGGERGTLREFRKHGAFSGLGSKTNVYQAHLDFKSRVEA